MSFFKKLKPKSEPINSADDLFDIHNCFMKKRERWIFRGQKKREDKNTKQLMTTLEKAIISFRPNMGKAPEIELDLLRKFKRHSAIYLNNIPAFYDYMGWFALMQHYGAPTRLQDWTYSFFVAVYLAINDMDKNAEVWAINTKYIENKAKHIIGKKSKIKDELKNLKCKINDIVKNDACAYLPGLFEKIFMDERVPFVLPMNPNNLNERLIIQQGIFLCPGDICQDFEDNLRANFSDDDGKLIENDLINNKNIRRFKITNNAGKKKKILQHLQRMNMNNATLFPDLSGFSKSLRTLLAFPSKKDGGMLAPSPAFVNKYLYSMNKR